MLFMISTVTTTSLFVVTVTSRRYSLLPLTSEIVKFYLLFFSSGREAEEVEPILDALPKLEQ